MKADTAGRNRPGTLNGPTGHDARNVEFESAATTLPEMNTISPATTRACDQSGPMPPQRRSGSAPRQSVNGQRQCHHVHLPAAAVHGVDRKDTGRQQENRPNMRSAKMEASQPLARRSDGVMEKVGEDKAAWRS